MSFQLPSIVFLWASATRKWTASIRLRTFCVALAVFAVFLSSDSARAQIFASNVDVPAQMYLGDTAMATFTISGSGAANVSIFSGCPICIGRGKTTSLDTSGNYNTIVSYELTPAFAGTYRYIALVEIIDGTARYSQTMSFIIQVLIRPGDVNQDGNVDAIDIVSLVNSLFGGGSADADVNSDGVTNVCDVFYLINYVFAGGAQPR